MEEKRELNKLRGKLTKLQEEAEQEAREQAARSSWGTYLASFVTGSPRETAEVKVERERRLLNKRAAQRIQEQLLEKQQSKVRNLETCLQYLDGQITEIQSEIRRDKLEERQREAQKRQSQAEERRKAEEERILRESEIRRRKQAEAEIMQRKHRAAEMKVRFQNSNGCEHKTWWHQIEGSHLCTRCSRVTKRFAFQCPNCNTAACASCRDILKRPRSRQFRSQVFQDRDDGYKPTWSEHSFEDDRSWDYWDYWD